MSCGRSRSQSGRILRGTCRQQKYLKDKFGTTICYRHTGWWILQKILYMALEHVTKNTEKKLSEEESASVCQDEPEIPYLQNRLSEPQEITLIGEAVTMGSLAAAIEKKYHKAVRVICPLETNAGLLALNDRVTKGEEEVQELLKDARIIIADPLYRPICPKSSSFYELPHIAFSGRIFLRGIKEGKYLSEI